MYIMKFTNKMYCYIEQELFEMQYCRIYCSPRNNVSSSSEPAEN